MTTPQKPSSESLSITRELIERAKDGDGEALNVLMSRFSPRLIRWATGRLPGHARSLLDTGDLVQDVLISTLARLDRVEVQVPGQFQAYVRKAILNRIRDQVRSARKWTSEGIAESLEDRAPSPLEAAIGSDVIDRYERALNSLPEEDARLLHLRVELHLTYEEIATILERSSPDAVRMAAQRALGKLAKLMGYGA